MHIKYLVQCLANCVQSEMVGLLLLLSNNYIILFVFVYVYMYPVCVCVCVCVPFCLPANK